MMNWIIFLCVGVIITVLSLRKCSIDSSWVPFASGMVGIIIVMLSIVVILVGVLQVPQSINNFTKQKAYIETHEAKNAVEDAALTSKKIELNEWLYDAQCSKSRFGSWSFYPESIFELEPIE